LDANGSLPSAGRLKPSHINHQKMALAGNLLTTAIHLKLACNQQPVAFRLCLWSSLTLSYSEGPWWYYTSNEAACTRTDSGTVVVPVVVKRKAGVVIIAGVGGGSCTCEVG